MPRTGRTFQRAVCYRVMSRGLNRQMVFEDEADHEAFKDLVSFYKRRTGGATDSVPAGQCVC